MVDTPTATPTATLPVCGTTWSQLFSFGGSTAQGWTITSGVQGTIGVEATYPNQLGLGAPFSQITAAFSFPAGTTLTNVNVYGQLHPRYLLRRLSPPRQLSRIHRQIRRLPRRHPKSVPQAADRAGCVSRWIPIHRPRLQTRIALTQAERASQ